MTAPTQVEHWRKFVAGVGGVVASLALASTIRHDVWKLFIPLLGLLAAAGIVHRATLGAQLLARAIWWANLGLASVLCFVASRDMRFAGAVMALGCGIALVVIGRKGLAEASERANYAPPAFRSSLLLLMVLGLADAQTFLLFAFLDATDHHAQYWIFLPIGIAYLVGFLGLYRLAIWGAIVNMAASAIMIGWLLYGGLNEDRELRTFLLVLCSAQLLAATPMTIALLRKRPLFTVSQRARSIGAPAAVVALVALDLLVVVAR